MELQWSHLARGYMRDMLMEYGGNIDSGLYIDKATQIIENGQTITVDGNKGGSNFIEIRGKISNITYIFLF